MYIGAAIELADEGDERGFADVGRQLVLDRYHADLARGRRLTTDVDLAREFFPHQHHRQPRRHAPLALECLDAQLEAFAQVLGDRLTIDDGRTLLHGASPRHHFNSATRARSSDASTSASPRICSV